MGCVAVCGNPTSKRSEVELGRELDDQTKKMIEARRTGNSAYAENLDKKIRELRLSLEER